MPSVPAASVTTPDAAAAVGPVATGPVVQIDDVDRGRAILPAAILFVAGVLAALAPTIGVVRSYDGSTLAAWTSAGWVAVLPGVLALVVAGLRPVAGLAVTAGAGAVGVGRLVADLSVVFSPDAVARPELFVETTARAQPFGFAVGGALLLFAELLMIGAGLLAAGRLARAVGLADEAPVGFGDHPVTPTVIPAPPTDPTDPAALAAPADVPTARRPRRRSSWLLFTGFAGVALILGGSVPVAYAGGYLDDRFLPVGGDVAGTVGVVLVAIAGALAVLCAAALPRQLACALLAGYGLAAAVPALVAVLAVLAGAPTSLSGSVWFVLVGAVVVAAAGLLTRVRLDVADRADAWADRPWFRWVVAGLGAVAAAAAALAAALPQLYVDGAVEPAVDGVVPQGAGLPIVFAGLAVIMAAGSVAALVPAIAAAGRAVLMVAVGGAVFAVTGALDVLNTLAVATRQAAGTDSALYGLVSVRVWTAGPGLWVGVVGLLLAAAAAVSAGLADRAAVDADPVAVDDDVLADSRRWRWPPAVAAGLLAIVAFAAPTYETVLGAAATLLDGFSLAAWGVWALLAVVLGAVVMVARDRRPVAVAGFGVAAAAVSALRLLVPASVSTGPDFVTRSGTALTWALVGVLLVVTATATMMVRKVPPAAPVPPARRGPKANKPPAAPKGKKR